MRMHATILVESLGCPGPRCKSRLLGPWSYCFSLEYHHYRIDKLILPVQDEPPLRFVMKLSDLRISAYSLDQFAKKFGFRKLRIFSEAVIVKAADDDIRRCAHLEVSDADPKRFFNA